MSTSAGLTPPPATWADLLAFAKKAQKPPRVFGLGIPVSNQTDSQVWEDMMKSYGARLADEAERWLGKPVVAVNAAMFWDALRRLGIPDRVDGFGRLLREH